MSYRFSLLLASIIIILNIGVPGAVAEEETGVLAFNTINLSSLAKYGSQDRNFSTSSGFELKKGYPCPRIFTPNGDHKNDQVTFSYKNDNLSSIVCWIYDIKGAVIRQLDIEGLEEEGEFTWNGKDEDGNLVPSGVYIYQIEVEGRAINGTIVLAK
jgi:gliding motility-associated-like protein